MTAKETAAIIGRHAVMTLDGFQIPVIVSDVRVAFGRIDYEVTPIGGAGIAWVAAKRVDVSPIDVVDALNEVGAGL